MKLLLVVALSVAGLTAAEQSQPRFSTSVNLLVVSAVVRNADGSITSGLTRDDFELLEDGKPLPIATFAEVNTDSRTSLDDGRFIVLLLDDLGTDAAFTTRIKQTAHAFVDRMGPKDVLSVVFLDGSNSTTTSSKAELHKAIDQRKGFGRAVLSPPGSGHTMRTVSGLSAQLARVGHRRKLLVFIGPAAGFNTTDLRGDTGEALRDSAQASLTTYAIDPLGLTEKSALAPRPIDAGGLAPPQTGITSKGAGFTIDNQGGFARETGGLVFANMNVLAPAVNQVWEEAGNYYLLGYDRPQRDSKRHLIEVRVKRPGVDVRARRTRG